MTEGEGVFATGDFPVAELAAFEEVLKVYGLSRFFYRSRSLLSKACFVVSLVRAKHRQVVQQLSNSSSVLRLSTFWACSGRVARYLASFVTSSFDQPANFFAKFKLWAATGPLLFMNNTKRLDLVRSSTANLSSSGCFKEVAFSINCSGVW